MQFPAGSTSQFLCWAYHRPNINIDSLQHQGYSFSFFFFFLFLFLIFQSCSVSSIFSSTPQSIAILRIRRNSPQILIQPSPLPLPPNSLSPFPSMMKLETNSKVTNTTQINKGDNPMEAIISLETPHSGLNH